ncbi:MAG: PorV/PorQ family protein [Elusimicrobia bacterium]|nr:PorV/PorQ family protein [Elusimicrobiota bacterium]
MIRFRSGAVFARAAVLAAAAVVCAVGEAGAFSGAEGASFLDIPVGGRPAALGSAYSSLAADSYAPIWNPAGLGALSQGEASLMHLSYLEAMSYESVSVAVPVQKLGGGLGASLQYFRAGSTPGTDAGGNGSGDFTGYYMAAGLGYGRSVGKRLALGAVGRLITAQIAGVGASALAADVGAMGRVGSRLRVSAVAANLGSGLRFLQESDPLPSQLRLGGAIDVVPQVTVSLEGVRAFRSDDSVHAGVEWRANQVFAVRAGYRSDVTREVGGMAGLTLGTGLCWKGYSFDYAWVPLGDLGQSQYLSLAVRFGEPAQGPDRVGEGSIIVLP